MDELYKANASRILSCYSNNNDVFEKGGKRATLGEVRVYNNGEKWKKTQNGWEPVKDIHETKNGKAKAYVHKISPTHIHYTEGMSDTPKKDTHEDFKSKFVPHTIHEVSSEGQAEGTEHVSNYHKSSEKLRAGSKGSLVGKLIEVGQEDKEKKTNPLQQAHLTAWQNAHKDAKEGSEEKETAAKWVKHYGGTVEEKRETISKPKSAPIKTTKSYKPPGAYKNEHSPKPGNSPDKYDTLRDGEKVKIDGKHHKLELIKHKGEWGSLPSYSAKVTHPETGEIKVLPHAVQFHEGYDQGHNSGRQYYADVAGYGTSNGGGQSSISTPYLSSRHTEHLGKHFEGKETFSVGQEERKKSIRSYPKGTKNGDIEKDISGR